MNQNLVVDFILNKLPEHPQSAMIIGSGLGQFTSTLQESIQIPYADIPDYPNSSVRGHAGEWVFGYIKGKPIICASGRFHYYEGFSLEQVAMPVSIIHALGCQTLFITNAAGCLVSEWDLGDIMLIQGYIDYSFLENSESPSIVFINIDSSIFSKVKAFKSDFNLNLREGIYTWTLGPSYETPAEIHDIISLGGNAVGMSTVPEIMKAQELKLDVMGISCLTNFGAGLMDGPINHESVLEITREVQDKFSDLMQKII